MRESYQFLSEINNIWYEIDEILDRLDRIEKILERFKAEHEYYDIEIRVIMQDIDILKQKIEGEKE